MKKNIIAILSFSCITSFSCNEKVPLSISTNTVAVKDTTYAAPVETQLDRMVLIEYATGVKCPNCPAGAKILKDAEDKNPGRLIIVAEHGGTFTSPISGLSKDTFGLNEVELLFNTYFGGEPNKPAAAIDRIYRNSNYFVGARGTWLSLIEERMSTKPSMNLSINSIYDENTDQYYITVKGAYTSTIGKKQRLTMMLLENNIIDPQYDGSNVINDYVLRAFLTDYTGTPLLDSISVKEAGRVFEKTIIYKIPDEKRKWKVENVNVVAFVHNDEGLDKDIQQAATVKLKP